jgi:acyl-CoA synthetase (AMP-forming)/AMP-acid ligase II
VTPVLLHDLLDRQAEQRPDAPALTANGQTWSYQRLRDLTVAGAGWLRRQGVGPGDRVLTLATGEPQTVVVTYAVSRLGAIGSIVSDHVRPFHLAHILADCAPRLVVTTTEAVEMVQRLADEHLPDASVRCLDELPARRTDELLPGPGLSIDPVAMIYTSGSTGMPKAVVSNHRQMLFATLAIQDRLCYRSDDSVFCCLPLSFDYGLYQAYLSCLAGARFVLGGPADAGPALLGRLRDEQITVFPAVPSLAATLTRLLGRAAATLDRLRMVTNTGASLSPALCAQLRAQVPGLAVVSMFGLTECKRVSIEEPNADLVRPGSVGLPLADTEAYVVDSDGRRLPTGEVGELVVRGPHVMCGYWRAPELTAQRFRRDQFGQPLLYTGDRCRLDPAGRIYFVGRDDDIYKQNGFRVSSIEVEAAALDIPAVHLAAVLPPDGTLGARLFVTGAITREALVTELGARLDRNKLPDELHVVDSIPLTVAGKIDKPALAAAEIVAGGAQ